MRAAEAEAEAEAAHPNFFLMKKCAVEGGDKSRLLELNNFSERD